MKIALILQSNNPEHAWNCFRFGITAMKNNHSVKIFLLSEGVEVLEMTAVNNFDVSKKLKEFEDLGGKLLACGTCIQSRKEESTEVCNISTMVDLLNLVIDSDKVITF